MKILFCTHEPFYPLSGGCTAGNWNIVRALSRARHEVTVAAPLYVDAGPVEAEIGARIVKVAPFRMHRSASLRLFRYGLYTVFYAFAVARLLRREEFDAVLVRNAVLAWPVCVATRRRRIPAVLSLTDFLTAFLREDRRVPRWITDRLWRFEMMAAGWFDRVVVITPRMKEELLKERPGLRGRVVVGYDGVDADLFDPARYAETETAGIRRELGVSDRLIIYHGTIEPHHGEEVIHRILERLAAGDDCDVLVIAGGRGYENLRRRVRSPRIRFMDFVPHDRVPAYLAAARVGIVPYPPNFGLDLVYTLKLLEYLAMNLPAVTFDLASVRDTFGDDPFVAVTDTPAEFAEAARSLLFREPDGCPRNKILEKFTWDRVAGVLAQTLADAAREPLGDG